MKPPLRVPLAGIRSGTIELSPEAAHYVFRVHRLKPGQPLVLFDPAASIEASATVTSELAVAVGEVRQSVTESLPLHLFQAVGKADKPEQVIRDATVLGARAITLVVSQRTVVRESSSARRDRFQRVLVEAARQSGRSDIPDLQGPVSFAEALGAARGRLRLLCAPTAGALSLRRALERALDAATERGASDIVAAFPVDVLIGPEGGLSADEIQAAEAAGFERVHLGPLILRTETAATAVLGFLRLFLDR